MSNQRIMQCFFNVDMRCAHDGLSSVARKQGVDVNKLEPGEYVVFVNAAKDRIKLFASRNVVAYYKTRSGERLDLRAIAEIPKQFTASGNINYTQALKTALEKALERKNANVRSPNLPR